MRYEDATITKKAHHHKTEKREEDHTVKNLKISARLSSLITHSMKVLIVLLYYIVLRSTVILCAGMSSS
jgi:hypothetical protein